MRKSTFLYQSKGSAARFRRVMLGMTFVWVLLLCFQFSLGYVLVNYQFTSPVNGLLMAVGAATLVLTAFTWNGSVGRTLMTGVFLYTDHVKMRYRSQPARELDFPKPSEFRLYRFPGLRRGYLRVSAPNSSALLWIRISDANELERAFQAAGISFAKNHTVFPSVVLAMAAVLAINVYFDQPAGLWVGGAAIFSWLYSLGFFHKPPLPEDAENPHRGNQMRVMGHSLAMLVGMWAILAAQQIAFSDADRSYFSTRDELREGKYSLGVSHAIRLAEETESALHLNFAAWVLTTVPDGTLRNYAHARELAERALAFGNTPQIEDTIACALMGSGKKEDAIALAERESLTKRLPDFQAGKLCDDPTLFADAGRGLASDENSRAPENREDSPLWKGSKF